MLFVGGEDAELGLEAHVAEAVGGAVAVLEKGREEDVELGAGEGDEVEAAVAVEVPGADAGGGDLAGEVGAEDLDEHGVGGDGGDDPLGLQGLGAGGAGLPALEKAHGGGLGLEGGAGAGGSGSGLLRGGAGREGRVGYGRFGVGAGCWGDEDDEGGDGESGRSSEETCGGRDLQHRVALQRCIRVTNLLLRISVDAELERRIDRKLEMRSGIGVADRGAPAKPGIHGWRRRLRPEDHVPGAEADVVRGR